MGLLIKDLANDLNIEIKDIMEFLKAQKKIKTYKGDNGLEIRSGESLINFFLNIRKLNENLDTNKILESFNNHIKKTKEYQMIKEKNKIDELKNLIKLAYTDPKGLEKKYEEKVYFKSKYEHSNIETEHNLQDNISKQNTNSLNLKNINEKNTESSIELKNIKKIKLKIENLKNIKNLENFEIELNNDIYIITGNNGTGKSTLLAALGQLVNKNSLSQEFPGNLFENSKIYFTLIDSKNNESNILYKKFRDSTQTKHWQSYIIKKDIEKEKNINKINGLIESGIEGERLNKFDKNLRQKILEHIEKTDFNKDNKNLIEEKKLTEYFKKITNKNYIFYSYKYSYKEKDDKENTKTVTKDIIIYYIEDEKKYLPEFTLSTGEYFIIQILNQLIKKINTLLPSLVILDEIELALNPKLQIRFVDFLKQEFCKKYKVTFILATQSISFIDKINNVYLIRNNNGKVSIFDNFKGKIIKTYLGENKTIFDKLIIVEDFIAKIFIENLISDLNTKYLYIIFPFGGKDQIAKHFKEEKLINQFANDIIIIYDGDVEKNIIKEIKSKINIEGNTIKEIDKNIKKINKELQENFKEIKNKYIINNIFTSFLPIDNVEEYIKQLITEENKKFVEKIQQKIIRNTTFFDIKDKLSLHKNKKSIFKDFIKELKTDSNYEENEIINKLINIIIELNMNNSKFKNLKEKINDFLKNQFDKK